VTDHFGSLIDDSILFEDFVDVNIEIFRDYSLIGNHEKDDEIDNFERIIDKNDSKNEEFEKIENNSNIKKSKLIDSVNDTKNVMNNNINTLNQNIEKLDLVNDKSKLLSNNAERFKNNIEKLKKL
jgi:hypothetical protein